MYVLNEFYVSELLNEEQSKVVDEGLFYMIIMNKIDKANKVIDALG